jgi:hypothetical protein
MHDTISYIGWNSDLVLLYVACFIYRLENDLILLHVAHLIFKIEY